MGIESLSDTAITLIAFGIVLALNLLSLLFYHIFEKEDYKYKPKGEKIFFNFWMCLCGICYWILKGIIWLKEKLFGGNKEEE